MSYGCRCDKTNLAVLICMFEIKALQLTGKACNPFKKHIWEQTWTCSTDTIQSLMSSRSNHQRGSHVHICSRPVSSALLSFYKVMEQEDATHQHCTHARLHTGLALEYISAPCVPLARVPKSCPCSSLTDPRVETSANNTLIPRTTACAFCRLRCILTSGIPALVPGRCAGICSQCTFKSGQLPANDTYEIAAISFICEYAARPRHCTIMIPAN